MSGAALSGGGRFASLAEGGRALAGLLLAEPGVWRGSGDRVRVVVAAVVPNGVPAGVEVARALGVPLVGVEVARTDDGVEVRGLDLPDADVVLVVDDAVETGRAAVAVGAAVRAAGEARVVLAVPVCPRQSEAGLAGLFDAVVAPVRPLARRSLEWHYPGFVGLPVEDARAAVSGYERERTTG